MASYSFDTVMTGTAMVGVGGGAVFGQDPVRAPVGVGVGAGAGYIGGIPPLPVRQPPQQVLPAVLAPLLPAIGGVLPAVGGVLAAGAAIYGGLQALGLGEGGGLFGINLLGGDEFTRGGLEFGGPGLPEPLAPYTEWHSGNKQFYHVPQYTSTGKSAGAKIAMYNKDTKKWKVWRLPKPHLAVIGKNMPRHQMIVRLRKNLMRHTADAKTILKLTSPGSLAKPQHRGHWAPSKTWHK